MISSAQVFDLAKKLADLDGDGQLTLKDLLILIGMLQGLAQSKEMDKLQQQFGSAEKEEKNATNS